MTFRENKKSRTFITSKYWSADVSPALYVEVANSRLPSITFPKSADVSPALYVDAGETPALQKKLAEV